MADAKNPPPEPAADRVVTTSRVLAASREAIFAAVADQARVARWWGPQGFTNTIEEFDFRPGGTWRLIMHAPDGTNYPNRWVFREILPPARLVLEHLDSVHAFTLAITLAAQDGGTRLTWRMTFATAAECARVRAFVTPANEETLDRLATLLAQPNFPQKT